MHSRDIIFVVLLVANIMPKEERCLDGAKFPNDFPPSSQTELRQMTEQNSAKLPSEFAPNDRMVPQSLEVECRKV